MIIRKTLAGCLALLLSLPAVAAEDRAWVNTLERISSGVCWTIPTGLKRTLRNVSGK